MRIIMKKWHKSVAVVLGAVLLSTVAIQASDLMRNINGNLVGLAIEGEGVCGAGSVAVSLGSGTLCVDRYEAAVAETCPVSDPNTPFDTQKNLNDTACESVSEEGKMPWKYVSLAQAQQLCARSGKRLPNNDEWYALASAVRDYGECNTSGTGARATGVSTCSTPSGIYDLVGNVWEWVDAQVTEGVYDGRVLPESGYVDLVDADGIVIETARVANEDYGKDYALTNAVGVRGVLRGGFFGSEEDAGLYAQNLAVPLDLKAPGVGFRCVRSL